MAMHLRPKRAQLQVSLVVSGCDQNGTEFMDGTSTENVSRNGCCLFLSRPLERNQTLRLKIQNGRTFEASVRWFELTPDSSYRVGFQLNPATTDEWIFSDSEQSAL